MDDKRSPIKQMPLHNPGESTYERLNELAFDKVGLWSIIALICVVTAALEWYRSISSRPPMPWPLTITAVFVCAFAIWQISKSRPLLRQYRQGWEGEKAVGQTLDELRTKGYQIIHDLVGDGFNIDHVLVGPTGVYAIETKTRSKPSGNAEVLFDGTAILVDGFVPDRDPLVQAKAAASYVSELLVRCLGEKLPVRPVVLFPGWYVRRRCRKPEVWVLNDKHLEAFLDHEDERLSEQQVCTIANAIATHVRASTPR